MEPRHSAVGVVVRCTLQLAVALAVCVGTPRCSPVRAFAAHVPGAPRTRGAWVDLGASPGAALGHCPQGMTLAGDAVLLTNHRHDTGAGLFVFDRGSFRLRHVIELPPDVTHPGGLAADGPDLWMVDYNSNRLYRLDLAATLARRAAVIVASYPTGLRGTSALALVTIDEARLLPISDFGVPGAARTYLLPIHRVGALARRPLRELAVVSYDSGGFSQGLAWDGALPYERMAEIWNVLLTWLARPVVPDTGVAHNFLRST